MDSNLCFLSVVSLSNHTFQENTHSNILVFYVNKYLQDHLINMRGIPADSILDYYSIEKQYIILKTIVAPFF